MQNSAIHAMVISPHPADPEFGIGGTCARWLREGKEVVYVICTNGDKGTSDPDIRPEQLAGIREQEQLKAAGLIGIKNVVFLRHPDLGLEDTPALKKELLKLILTHRPRIVATCDPNHSKYIANPDHRFLGQAVMDVVWPMCLAPNGYRDLLAEGLELHRVQEVLLWQAAEPNFYVNISEYFDLKMKAALTHQTQIGPKGNAPEFDKYLTEMAKIAGKAIGCEWGEAFHRIEVLQRL